MNSLGKLALSLALAANVTVFATTDGRAQSATDLKCNECVGPKDLAKNAVRKSRIANKAVSPAKLSVPTGAAGTSSVSKELAAGDQIVTKIVVKIPGPGVVVVNASGFTVSVAMAHGAYARSRKARSPRSRAW